MAIHKIGNKYQVTGAIKVDGKRKDYKRSFDSKRAAQRWEIEYREKTSLVEGNAKNDVSLKACCDAFLESKKGKIKTSTYVLYRKNFQRLQEYFGDVKVNEISERMANKYVEIIYGKFSMPYANKLYESLAKILSYAKKRGYTLVNVMGNIERIKNPDTIQKPLNYWEIDEFNVFIKEVPEKYKDIFYFLFFVGVRIGELQGLQWKQVNFKENTVHISQQYSHVTRGLTSPKTKNSNRVVYLSQDLATMLLNRYNAMKVYNGFNEEWYVFGANKNIDKKTIEKYMKRGITLSEVKPITIHGLRHSCASLLISRGLQPTIVADYLGDTTEMILKTYAHVYKGDKIKVSNTIQGIMKGAK